MFTPGRDCGSCRRTFENIKKVICPCDDGECPFGKPKLWIGNHLVWDLYQQVSGQVIVAGMGDVLGIKFEAIQFIFDLYGIMDRDEKLDLFNKILAIDSVRMKIRSETIMNNMNQSKKGKR